MHCANFASVFLGCTHWRASREWTHTGFVLLRGLIPLSTPSRSIPIVTGVGRSFLSQASCSVVGRPGALAFTRADLRTARGPAPAASPLPSPGNDGCRSPLKPPTPAQLESLGGGGGPPSRGGQLAEAVLRRAAQTREASPQAHRSWEEPRGCGASGPPTPAEQSQHRRHTPSSSHAPRAAAQLPVSKPLPGPGPDPGHPDPGHPDPSTFPGRTAPQMSAERHHWAALGSACVA